MNQCICAKYFLLALIVCCASMSQTAAEEKPGCPVACTHIYAPVCATDGNTYKMFGNECSIKQANCYATKEYTATNDADCPDYADYMK